MAMYNWSSLVNGQVVSFNPGVDILNFDDSSISARALIVALASSVQTQLAVSGKTVTFSVVIGAFTTTNVTFANGSLFVVGDNTTDTSADDQANTLIGGTGDDFLIGRGGNDSLFGGDGNDKLAGELGNLGGNNTLNGGAGTDTALYGTDQPAVIVNLATGIATSSLGTDVLISIENVLGTNFADTLIGNADANSLSGRGGNDTLDGGAGIDTADYNNATASVTVNLSTGTSSGAHGNDTLISIENIRGGSGNDILTGDAGNNSLQGGSGDDVLRQTQGADTLNGGAGFDRIDFTQTGITYGGATGVTVNLATHVADLNNSAAGADSTLVSIESVFGTAGNDSFTGGDPEHAPDALGNSTAENFRPSGGNDTITGGIGYGVSTRVDYANSTNAITVNLGTGIASDGFGGTDVLVRVDQVFGGSGNDVLYGGSLERSAGGDFFEVFRGNAGNDTIDGAGTDTVLGGGGTNRANYFNSPASVIVNLGTGSYVVGNDTVPGGAARDGFGFTDTLRNINQAQGSVFSDTLVGGADNHRLIGEAGSDTLVGAAYGVEASYQNAASAVAANLATGTASDGQGGTDTLIDITDLRGSDFDDTLTGNDADNLLTGLAGADTIDGGAGIDFAGYSATAYSLGGVNAFIENGSGTITDPFGATDTLINIEGLNGSNSNDTLAGGLGNQWFIGRGGSDTLDGGAGNDWATYIDDPAGVTVNLGTGTAADGWGGVWAFGGTDTLVSIENAEGSDFADTLVGSAEANNLTGGEGDDSLVGGDGNDTLMGGAGNDTLDGGAGVDSLVGGAGDDRYLVDNVLDVVVEASGEGTDTVVSSVTITLPDNVENGIYTGPAGGAILGNAQDNVITGNVADETLSGGAGNDTVSYAYEVNPVTVNLAEGIATGSGTDTLIGFENAEGGSGADTLIGTSSANVLDGRGGADTMQGGSGNDTYYVDNALEEVVETSNSPGLSLASAAAESATLGFESAALEGITDTVIAAVNYSLTAFVENLTLAWGSAAATGTGNAEDNVLTANELNNTLTGLAGNDTLDGGAGADTAVYSNASAAYTVTPTASGYTVSGSEGTDTLSNIERLQFSDQSLAFDMTVSEAGGKTALLLGACLGASGLNDKAVVGAILGYFDGGYTLTDAATALVGAGIVAQLAGGADNKHFVDWMALNLVDAVPDPATEDVLISFITSGQFTQATFLATLAAHQINQDHIGLVGLQQNGMEFV